LWSCSARDAQQQIEEWFGRADARLAVSATAAGTDLTQALCPLQPHALDHSRIEAGRTDAPIELGRIKSAVSTKSAAIVMP
jgi:hypothetical protein